MSDTPPGPDAGPTDDVDGVDDQVRAIFLNALMMVGEVLAGKRRIILMQTVTPSGSRWELVKLAPDEEIPPGFTAEPQPQPQPQPEPDDPDAEIQEDLPDQHPDVV